MLAHRSSSSSRTRPSHSRWVIKMGIGCLASALTWLTLAMLWHRSYAQTFTDEEIGNYAAAVVAMEDIRSVAYGEISDLMTIAKQDVTRHDLRCGNSDSLKQLPRRVRLQVRRWLINYCNDAKKIVEDTGLTAEIFNRMTVTHQEDETLAEQIKSEIVRIR